MTGRARGGLASSLLAALSQMQLDTTWICAAMDDDEREIVASGSVPVREDGIDVVMVVPDRSDYSMAYDVVSNSVLWFVYHDLFDKVRRPFFDAHWDVAWDAYRSVNRLFAHETARRAPEGATVLVQDYQLHLVGSYLQEVRPDLTIVHFVHTPFCDPSVLGVLPDRTALELLSSMGAYDAVGFHADRWCSAFESCCSAWGVTGPPGFSAPMGADENGLMAAAVTPEVQHEKARIARAVGDRQLIVRVDRMEPSKNILRGFLAFDRLLEASPSLRGRVSFLALTYPSRESLAEYRTYRAEIETLVRRINSRWTGQSPPALGLDEAEGSPGTWQPIILEVDDYFPRSLAAMSSYDVMLVNPVRDGLNLVAKEGPIVNERNGVVVLSTQAGVWDELADVTLGVNPFDISETASALQEGLSMARPDRNESAKRLRDAVVATDPTGWLGAQIAAGSSARR